MSSFSNVSLPISLLSAEALQCYEQEIQGSADHDLDKRIDSIRKRLLDCCKKDHEKFVNQSFHPKDFIRFFEMILSDKTTIHLPNVKLNISTMDCFCYTTCPFNCSEKVHYTCQYNIKDVANQKTYTFSGAIPHLITSHGFFGEEGTEYRLDPEYLFPLFKLCDKNEKNHKGKKPFKIFNEKKYHIQKLNKKQQSEKKAKSKNFKNIASEKKIREWDLSFNELTSD